MAHEDLLTPDFARMIIRFITGRRGSPIFDDDLTQEALLHAVAACRRVHAIAHPHAFFGKVIRDTVFDSWRRRRPIEVELKPERMAASDSTAEENVDRQRKLDQIRRALQKLDQRDQFIVERFYFDDCAIREIADELHESESAIKMVLVRSREKLRNSLRIYPSQRN